MPVIITGTNGPIYLDFPSPTLGAWSLPIMGTHPYNYYLIGGTKYHINPKSIYSHPFWGPGQSVPFH